MKITCHTREGILTLALAGRLDASNASAVGEELLRYRAENRDKQTVIDAEALEYISSAGLRVILKLRREDPSLSIINVSPQVYEVLEMTGFTEMVTVEKALRRLSTAGCEFIARGANGAVYRYDEETILKVYFAPDALPEIRQERENARKAFVLGVNTAIPYGIVRVDEGYGTVTELLNAQSISQVIRKDPDRLEEPVGWYIDMLRSIHAITVEPGTVPDMHETAMDWARFVAPHLEQGEKLLALVAAVPHRNTLLHGDYHTNNVMVREGEPLLIDMDTLCMGHPIFELGSMFNAFVGFSELDPPSAPDFLGYSFETAGKMWRLSLEQYLNTRDPEVVDRVAEKAMIMGHTRMLRRALRRPAEPSSPARIARSTQMLNSLLTRIDSLDF